LPAALKLHVEQLRQQYLDRIRAKELAKALAEQKKRERVEAEARAEEERVALEQQLKLEAEQQTEMEHMESKLQADPLLATQPEPESLLPAQEATPVPQARNSSSFLFKFKEACCTSTHAVDKEARKTDARAPKMCA
jgi:membrane protein involved in colicin uptake